MATALLEEVRSLAESPDEVGVEFGIKLSGTAGAIIASTAIEAHFKVTLNWKRG